MPPGLGRCPAQETLYRAVRRGGKGFEKPGPEGGKGFAKLQSRGGKGFEKVVRKGSLGFENRHWERRHGMERFFWICLAGAAGTGARYLIALWAAQRLGSAFPYGTLIVNVFGCFVIAA
jgi:hypothetical protein